jgi:hypothetical protein
MRLLVKTDEQIYRASIAAEPSVAPTEPQSVATSSHHDETWRLANEGAHHHMMLVAGLQQQDICR